MLLSELLGQSVNDATGRRLGTVVDIRLSLIGDLDHAPAEPCLYGILVSPHTNSSYLGYERSEIRYPKVLASLLRWRHRETFLALWDDVSPSDGPELALRKGFTKYSPVLQKQT